MQECSKKNRRGKIACPGCIHFHEQKNKSASMEEYKPQRKKGSEDSLKRKRYDIKFLSVDANPLQFDIGRIDMTGEHRSKMDSDVGIRWLRPRPLQRSARVLVRRRVDAAP